MARRIVAVLGATVLLAGCAHHSSHSSSFSSSHPSTGPSTNSSAPPVSTVAADYLRAADAANAQVAAARAGWQGKTDLGPVRAGLLAIAKAKEDLDATVRSLALPAADATDVDRLLAADLTFETDLRAAAATTTAADLTSLEPRLLASGQAAVAAANALRRDLGLPPVP